MLWIFTTIFSTIVILVRSQDEQLVNEHSIAKNELQKFVEANNAFALHLYKHLSANDGNIFFCSVCLSSSLTLLLDASAKETAMELKKSLHLQGLYLQMDEIRQQYSRLMKRMKSTDCLDQIANALFIQGGHELNAEFVTDSQDAFNTEIFETDFAGNQKQAMWEINEWIRNKSLGRIKRLFERSNSKSSMFLVNAASFKTNFKGIFDNNASLKKKFYNHGFYDNDVDIFMMEKQNEIQRVAISYDFRALELPCGAINDTSLKLWIFLPHKIGNLPDVEYGLSTDTFKYLRNSFEDTVIDISVPRIRIDFSRDVSKELQKLGIKSAFEGDAKFIELSKIPGLHLTEVLQRSIIDLNDNGVEPFYTDYYNNNNNSTMPKIDLKEHIPPFHANHPFMFFIVDVSKGLILYIGRVHEF